MKVGLIYSSCLIRESLAELIRHFGFEVSYALPKLDDLEVTSEDKEAEIVLLEFKDLADEEDAASVRRLLGMSPDSKIILFGRSDCARGGLEGALAAGARGFITNDASAEALESYLRLIASGITAIAAPVQVLTGSRSSTQERGSSHALSPREKRVLSFIARGKSNKMVARSLDISESTVKAHLKSILKKIGAHNRTQAAIWALSNGVVQDADHRAPS